MSLRKLNVDYKFLRSAMDRDEDQTAGAPVRPYFDSDTGAIVWAYEDEAAMQAAGGQPTHVTLSVIAAATPGRFHEIRGIDYDEDLSLLREFVGSPWTEDARERDHAFEALQQSRSIALWKRAVSRAATEAWRSYKDEEVEGRIRQWCETWREKGIEIEVFRSPTGAACSCSPAPLA
jgi:hypothetical protein